MKRRWYIGLLALMCIHIGAWGAERKPPTKGLLFFYRSGQWMDNYLLDDVDTAYIGLPEHSWDVALTSGMLGINSTLHSSSISEISSSPQRISIYNRTTPSVDLGFNVGYRGFGFGYSWDLLHAYTRKLNFSLGSRYICVDFSYQTSTNIRTRLSYNNDPLPSLDNENNVVISNVSLNAWYTLNAAHYDHFAATKQNYIQRKSAGSLMLHMSYLSSKVMLGDTIMVNGATIPALRALISGVRGVSTRQLAFGVGYGINYTPNHGKVVLHASAAAMLVCYSVNHIAYHFPDTIQNQLPGEALFTLRSVYPVHVTGNVRAAVSWEVNKWVHLSAWATGDHIRFRSEEPSKKNELSLSNWNWKVQVTVGVRFGAGRDRVRQAIGARRFSPRHPRHEYLPLWLTDYFWSPR